MGVKTSRTQRCTEKRREKGKMMLNNSEVERMPHKVGKRVID